jgi:HAD superfamily hydrolase (TIGR01509 family)
MIQAVIFDMDGVIVDSEGYHEQTFLAVMEEIGFGASHGIDFQRYVGRSDFELWQDFISLRRPAQTLEQLLEHKRRLFLDILRELEPIYDGVPGLVAKLRGRFALAVASGSERPIVNAVLDLRELAANFPVVVTGGEVERGKPAPDIFLHAAALLGVAPDRCCVIEDSKPGVAAARAAGMEVIAITNTHPAAELEHAHHVVSSYAEIERLLIGREANAHPLDPAE